MTSPVLYPGALPQRAGRASRLLFSLEAEDGTLQPRSGQAGTWSAGGGVGAPWTRGANGLFLQTPLQPRFEVGDADYDGILDDRDSLLLEPAVTNLIENASAELDLAGLFSQAAGVVTRETGQDLHWPGATAIGVAGAAIGDGVQATKRDGTTILTSVVNHAVAGWVKPNAATIGRSLKLHIEWRTAADAFISTTEVTTPVLRAGWQRVAHFVPASSVPGTAGRLIPKIVLASAGAGQAVSLAGWGLASGAAAFGSPVFTSTGQVTRQVEGLRYDFTRAVQPLSGLVTACLEAPLLPSAYAGNVAPYAVFGLGGSTDVAGGWLDLRWTGAGWSLARSVGGLAAASAPVLAPDTMKGWVDVLFWLWPDGGLQLGGLRGLVAGTLTEAPGSAKTGAQPTHIASAAWSSARLDVGAGHGGVDPGPWRIYAAKLSPGAGKTFGQLDGLI